MKVIGRALGLAASLAMLCSGAAEAAKKTSSVKIQNKSEWVITEFYMSESDEGEWGPDQLGDKVIRPGDEFTLTDIGCDLWDLRLVDEDEDECVLLEVDLCAEKAVWQLTSKELLTCQAESE